MPIYGHAVIGVPPSAQGKIIDLSKYDRIVEHFTARLQIQEELIKPIGNFIVEATQPRGLAVRVSAVHLCETQRGVRAAQGSRMVTAAFDGDMLTSHELRAEFLAECRTLERID
jgi:GTP cyclohydrolase IA